MIIAKNFYEPLKQLCAILSALMLYDRYQSAPEHDAPYFIEPSAYLPIYSQFNALL